MSLTRETNKCYATAQVGKDVIENVEYTDFGFSLYDRPKRKKSFKDRLYELWVDIILPLRRLKGKIDNIYWQVRYGFQRMFRGYDSVDCFDISAKFIERYYKILTQYRKNHWGYPYKLSIDEWDNIIDEMIYHLYYMNEENVEKELCKNMPENWHPSLITTNEIMDKHKDAFFELFSKYFFDLWD